MHFPWRFLLLLTAALLLLPPVTTAADTKKKVLVVTVTTGFRHKSIPHAEKALQELAEKSGAFEVDFVQQPPGKKGSENFQRELQQRLQKLSPDQLKNYDAVVFANTTGDLPIPDKAGFLQWLRDGGAFIGAHSASDTFHGWPEFIQMLGGEFESHGKQVPCECRVVNRNHPATHHLGEKWQIPQEEIYLFKNYTRDRKDELLVLDKHPNKGTPGHFPISWKSSYGEGRVFYTALGHREDLWDPELPKRKNPPEVSEQFRQHLLGGILWALGVDPGGSGLRP